MHQIGRDGYRIFCCIDRRLFHHGYHSKRNRKTAFLRSFVQYPDADQFLGNKVHAEILRTEPNSKTFVDEFGIKSPININDMKQRKIFTSYERKMENWANPSGCPESINSLLTDACEHAFQMNNPGEKEMEVRRLIRADLEAFLKLTCGCNLKLQLFGSSGNGFTFHESDIDLCLVLDNEITKKSPKVFLNRVFHSLKLFKGISSVRTIFGASVPIIKFFTSNGYTGDISLNNTLALRNTYLISSYVHIDRRCRTLGYMFKNFVKTRFNKNISSYAYIMLVIYFLQQCDPPVLPVLQEMHDGDSQPEIIIDGWNSWFFEDASLVPKVWDGFGKNKSSVGKLWFEMMKFYSEIFNYNHHVVCIRKKDILTKNQKHMHINYLTNGNHFQKQRRLSNRHWGKMILMVEDPFDHGHNLGLNIGLNKFRTEIDFNYRLLQAMANDPVFLSNISKVDNAHLYYLQELKRET